MTDLLEAIRVESGRRWVTIDPSVSDRRRRVLMTMAAGEGPADRVRALIDSGDFAAAEALIPAELDPPLSRQAAGELAEQLSHARGLAAADLRHHAEELRVRNERLGHAVARFDEDVTDALGAVASSRHEAAELLGLVEEALRAAEAAEADRLKEAAASLPDEVGQAVAGFVARRAWSSAELAIASGSVDDAGPPEGVCPPTLLFEASAAQVADWILVGEPPEEASSQWRELDAITLELVRAIDGRDPHEVVLAIAEALDGEVVEDEPGVVRVGGIMPAELIDRFGFDPVLSFVLDGTSNARTGTGTFVRVDLTPQPTAEAPRVAYDDLIAFALSPGDRRIHLARMIHRGVNIIDLYDRTGRGGEPTGDRLRVTIDIACAGAGADVAQALAFDAGHHPTLARVLLEATFAATSSDQGPTPTVADLAAARVTPATIRALVAALLDDFLPDDVAALVLLRQAAVLAAGSYDRDELESLLEWWDDDHTDARPTAPQWERGLEALFERGMAAQGEGDSRLVRIRAEPLHLLPPAALRDLDTAVVEATRTSTS